MLFNEDVTNNSLSANLLWKERAVSHSVQTGLNNYFLKKDREFLGDVC